MDFINRLYVQSLAFVRAMTPKARITAAALVVVILASLVYLVRHELAGQTTYLLAGQTFSIDEITVMQGALGKAQLNEFTVEDNRIRIPRSKQAAYLAALADGNALPQTLTDIFSAATDKATWFTSRQMQVEQARTAKKKGLSLILRSIDGVESAEVDFDKEEPRGLKQERIATALVAVKLRAGQTLSEGLATYFQSIAAAALTMSPQDVTVVDKTNHLHFGGRGSGGTGGAADEYHNLKRKYQAYYEETVRKALAYVPGITVSADVELDRELRGEEKRVELDANRAATVAAGEGQASLADEAADMNARPETAAQDKATQPAILDSLLPLGPNVSSGAARPQDGTPAHGRKPSEIAGLTPKRVAISVGVPTSYFANIWRQRHPARSGGETADPPASELAQVQADEIALIRQHVAPLIPGSDASGTANQLVTVTPFSHVVVADEHEPSLGAIVLGWLNNSWNRSRNMSWNAVALFAIVLVGPVTLWFVIRLATGPSRKSSAAVSESNDSHGAHAGVPPPHRPSESRLRLSTDRSLRDELADIVRENPAAAADVLRSWIGNVN